MFYPVFFFNFIKMWRIWKVEHAWKKYEVYLSLHIYILEPVRASHSRLQFICDLHAFTRAENCTQPKNSPTKAGSLGDSVSAYSFVSSLFLVHVGSVRPAPLLLVWGNGPNFGLAEMSPNIPQILQNVPFSFLCSLQKLFGDSLRHPPPSPCVIIWNAR